MYKPNIGHRGQRYETHCIGYPKDGDNVIGWTTQPTSSKRMCDNILLAPGAKEAYTLDLKTKEVVYRKKNNGKSS